MPRVFYACGSLSGSSFYHAMAIMTFRESIGERGFPSELVR